MADFIYLSFLTPICPWLKHWQRSRPRLEELLLRKQNTTPLPTDRSIPTQATHPLKSEKFPKWRRVNCQWYKIMPTNFSRCVQGYSESAGGEDVWDHTVLILWSIASKSAVSYSGHRPITSHPWTLPIDWRVKNSIGRTRILNVTPEAWMVTWARPPGAELRLNRSVLWPPWSEEAEEHALRRSEALWKPKKNTTHWSKRVSKRFGESNGMNRKRHSLDLRAAQTLRFDKKSVQLQNING